jgi:hypothetical protein
MLTPRKRKALAKAMSEPMMEGMDESQKVSNPNPPMPRNTKKYVEDENLERLKSEASQIEKIKRKGI